MEKPPKALRFFFALLLVMSWRSSLAYAQEQYLREGNPWEPERKADKIGSFYKVSELYLSGATVFDMWSTVKVLHHPTVAYRADNTVLAHYTGIETGWAGCFGNRNAGAAVAANVGLNAGLSFLSHKLYQRGGRWRILAIAVNVSKGTDNLIAGVHNVRWEASVNRRVQLATGYAGPIAWSR